MDGGSTAPATSLVASATLAELQTGVRISRTSLYHAGTRLVRPLATPSAEVGRRTTSRPEIISYIICSEHFIESRPVLV